MQLAFTYPIKAGHLSISPEEKHPWPGNSVNFQISTRRNKPFQFVIIQGKIENKRGFEESTNEKFKPIAALYRICELPHLRCIKFNCANCALVNIFCQNKNLTLLNAVQILTSVIYVMILYTTLILNCRLRKAITRTMGFFFWGCWLCVGLFCKWLKHKKNTF